MMPNATVMSLQHGVRERTGSHVHATGQLFVVREGAIHLRSSEGQWLVPSGCLGWVPPICAHEALFPCAVSGQSVYVDDGWSGRYLPLALKVVRLSPLLMAVLPFCLDEGLPARRRALYWQVLADGLSYAPSLSSGMALPQSSRLLAVVQQLLAVPDDERGLDDWALHAGMSRSTFMRHFRRETGLAFGVWRQQLRVWHAMRLLAEGRSVTEVALTVGYQSPSAFIQVFRRQLGMTPAAFVAQA
ncbi:AraC family transcriptional regulator [Paludibacterium sp. THUN1379]|uniref:helix-turn-helix transcriptional regulator n=1 Tax=Paludibacterium sp. THUN1379 TaxID=3112107 RepID=UPI0030CECD9E